MPASPRRRLALAAALCLFGGAAATVLVAWVAVLIVDLDAASFATSARVVRRDRTEHQLWVNRWRAPASIYIRSWAWPARDPLPGPDDPKPIGWTDAPPEQLIPSWARNTALPWPSGASPWPQRMFVRLLDRMDSREIEARGWPFLALWHEFSQPVAANPSHPAGGLVVPMAPRSRPWTNAAYAVTLSYRPIPLGFTLDTLFYAAVLGTLFLAPPRLRRSFRLRRGLCPACAYNLTGNTTGICPECGHACPSQSITH